jgi:hypothetical protein
MNGAYDTIGRDEKCIFGCCQKALQKTQFATSRPRLEDGIKMNLEEIWREIVDWIHQTQHRDYLRDRVNTVGASECDVSCLMFENIHSSFSFGSTF